MELSDVMAQMPRDELDLVRVKKICTKLVKVFESEKKYSHRNASLLNLMKSFGNIKNDIEQVLDFLRDMPAYEHIELKDLTLKTVMLLALSTGQRRQALQSIRVSGVTIAETTAKIVFLSKLKTTKPGKHQVPIILRPYEIHLIL